MYSTQLIQRTFKTEEKKTQFCVVGGGMAGLCAALAAARNGIRTTLIQDRAVLGGNASSEVRMWICGAHGAKETGLLEEIMLRNYYYNAELKYTIWDDVLYGICREEPLLEVIFSCSVLDVESSEDRITKVKAWHLTRQTWIEVEADFFADCSGDSILRICGAEHRWGRESKYEFNESHAPEEADDKTMGNSVLIQLREVDEHRPFTPPPWAKKFKEEELEHRGMHPKHTNFWWLEIGGLMDTIGDADKIRDENMAIAYGAWDFIKNHPDGRGHKWELEWIGSLPGKRENVRYVGDHILTQNDVEAEGRFEDIVAHGGWSMDDHHPDAINHRGAPTIFHPAPSPYGIPYRSLYSKDFKNLFFAGRNISATHMAMSSTRVMATTSVMGQAIGTAAAIAVQKGLDNRGVYQKELQTLQNTLMDQDQYIPWKTRQTRAVELGGQLSSSTGDCSALLNGIERDQGDDTQTGWWGGRDDQLTWTFDNAQDLESIRIVLDSDLPDMKRMPCSFPKDGNQVKMPKMLLRNAQIEILKDGESSWETFCELQDNFKRLIQIPLKSKVKGVRLTVGEPWEEEKAHIHSFDLIPS